MNDMTTPTGNMRDILHIIFKYKLIIIISAIISVSVGYYITTKYKAMYQASSKLLVKLGRESTEKTAR